MPCLRTSDLEEWNSTQYFIVHWIGKCISNIFCKWKTWVSWFFSLFLKIYERFWFFYSFPQSQIFYYFYFYFISFHWGLMIEPKYRERKETPQEKEKKWREKNKQENVQFILFIHISVSRFNLLSIPKIQTDTRLYLTFD